MEPGSHVRITTKNGLVFEGIVLQGEGVVLKLDNGYNVGIDERNIDKTEALPKEQRPAAKKRAVAKDAKLPRIRILHTGGTIASKVDYTTGGTSSRITPDELLAMYPELQSVAQCEADFIAAMSSDDMRFAQYNILAKAVSEARKEDLAGIIITQGTDTLHYTAAALHYALQGLDLPVVIVGSQRSSDRGSSDAATNLLGAARFIVSAKLPGVFVAMHEGSGDSPIAVMKGTNVRKNHSSRRDAFAPVNIPQVARVTDEKVEVLWEPPRPSGSFSLRLFNEDLKVGMAYMHPNLFPEELSCYESFDGLLIMGTGLGHAPINATDEHTKLNEKNFAVIQRLAEKMPVVMTTQCINGRVSLQVYGAGRRLQDAGVLGHDSALSPETVFVKLAWLLSRKEDAREGLEKDYGDAVPRIEEQAYDRS